MEMGWCGLEMREGWNVEIGNSNSKRSESKERPARQVPPWYWDTYVTSDRCRIFLRLPTPYLVDIPLVGLDFTTILHRFLLPLNLLSSEQLG